MKDRKRPVHMPLVERYNESVILFVTLAVKPRGDFLNNNLVHISFRKACRDADAWTTGNYLIMPDHVHLFCRPAIMPVISLKRWVVYLKERITKRIRQRCGRVLLWKWQNDFWDTQIRNGRHYEERWNYVCDNPVRANLVESSDLWPWQGEIAELRW